MLQSWLPNYLIEDELRLFIWRNNNKKFIANLPTDWHSKTLRLFNGDPNDR